MQARPGAWRRRLRRRQTAANPDKCRQDVRPHLPPAGHFAAKRHFVCGIRVTAVMTPAERQRRRRAKLAEIVHPEHVLAELDRAYSRAYLADQGDIRAGMKKLLRQWEKDAAARGRWWRKKSAAAAKRTRKKR